MTPLHPESETAEIRMLRCMQDLNVRLLSTESAPQRESLRATIEVIRTELLKLVTDFPVYSEEEIACLRQRHLAPGLPAALCQVPS